MKVKVLLKGYLVKYFGGERQRIIELDAGTTVREAIEKIGIDTNAKGFGFAAVNGMRVMIDNQLQEGDELKIYPRISGG